MFALIRFLIYVVAGMDYALIQSKSSISAESFLLKNICFLWKFSLAYFTFLLDLAEDLLDELEDEEPDDENSNEYDLWSNRLSETEDFIDRIQGRLDEPEDDNEEE